MSLSFSFRKTGFGLKLALLAFFLIVFAVAAEFLWRAVKPYVWGSNPLTVVFDRELGWRYKPNQKARHRSQDFDVTEQIDAAGHRIAPGEGERGQEPVAVFIGDSLTFGWGVEAEESFAFRLHHQLGYKVVNLGVSGYGTDQSYLSLKLHGLALKPALVVYTFCGNDLNEVLAEVRYGRPKPRVQQEGRRLALSSPRDSATFLNRHSQFYHSLRSYLDGFRDKGLGERELPARQLIGSLVRDMNREIRAFSATLIVVSAGTPWLAQATQTAPRAVYVGLDDAFERASQSGAALTFSHDPHWTGVAHRIVADEIATTVTHYLAAIKRGQKMNRAPRS